MIVYRAKFTPEKKGITVTFPEFPEAVTCGYSDEEAMEFAVDALQSVLSEYIRRRREIPRPKRPLKGMRSVLLPVLAEAKLQVYEVMRRRGIRKSDLARRLGWHKSQVDRLLELQHLSQLGLIEEALEALDKRLAIGVEDAPKRLHAGA